MMLLDHISTSIILTTSFKNKKIKKIKNILISIAIVSAIVPDILAFFYHPGSIEYLSHRRFTNSLLFAPIYSFLIAALFFFIFRKTHPSFKIFYFCSLSNYLLHIIFDLITPYGTILFYPISTKIYSMDILHSFDPVFLIISVVFIIVFVVFKIKKRFPPSKLLLMFTILYALHIILMLSFKYHHSIQNNSYINNYFPTAKYEATIPKTFWRWRGVAVDNKSYIIINNNINNIYRKSIFENQMIPISIQNDLYLNKFLDYARFPTIDKSNTTIKIGNAIYSAKSYQLEYKIGQNNELLSKGISGFDISDE